jgi:hypothetical protein
MSTAKFIVEHQYQVDTDTPIRRNIRLFRFVLDELGEPHFVLNKICNAIGYRTYQLPKFDAGEFAMGLVTMFKTGPGMVHYVAEDHFNEITTDYSYLIVHNQEHDRHLEVTCFDLNVKTQTEWRIYSTGIVPLDQNVVS